MPNHHHAQIQSRARVAFSLALPAIVALAALATTVAWAAPTTDATDRKGSPRMAATLTTVDGGKEACADEGVRLVCTVTFEGLEPTARYKAIATLIDTETGKAVENAKGKAVEATSAFSPEKQGGTLEMELSVDTRRQAGRRIGAVVTIRRGRDIIVTRECSEDPARIPKLTTRAHDETTGTRVAAAGDPAVVIDEVSYECLSPGTTYVLRGTVRDAEKGTVLMGEERRPIDGTEATREFTPTSASGTVAMSYRFDASALEGRAIFVAEELRRADGGPVIATCAGHDEIRFPSLSSVAVVTGEGTSVRDVLSYSNLDPGLEYTAEGTLRIATSEEPDGALVIDEYGDPITASATFTPEDEGGTVELDFDLTTAGVSDNVLVTTEQVTIDGHVVATSDDVRPVCVPQASVTLAGARTDLHEARAAKDALLVATVRYEDLPEGGDRTANVAIVDVQTGNALLAADGSVATAEVALDANESSGSVELPIAVDARALAGHSVAATACVHAGGSAIRADSDEEGIVRFPRLQTALCDAETDAHVTGGDGTATLCDTITYTGLMPDMRHTIKVTLTDATTGEPVDNGASSTSVSFVPESPGGTIAVSVPLVGRDLPGKAIASVDTLECEGVVTAEHEGGRTDAGRVRVPKASAVARSAASGDQEVPASEDAEVGVVVSCENLQPGLAYDVTCTLADTDDGKVLGADGTPLTATSMITPEGENATFETGLVFDARKLAGRTLALKAIVVLDGHTLTSCDARTLRIPSIATGPHAEGSESTEVAPSTSSRIVDSVSYTNLVPGREYVIEGELVDARTGKPAAATNQAQGRATARQGAATTAPADAQSPSPEPADATTAWVTDDGTYHLDGRCASATGTRRQTTLGIAKATGKTRCPEEATATTTRQQQSTVPKSAEPTESKQEERPAQATVHFTPAKPDGTVDVTFEMNTTSLEGTDLVALETLSRDGHVVIDSRDHADGRPGVSICAGAMQTRESTSPESMGQTGTGILPFVILGIGIALAIAGILVACAANEKDVEDGE